MKTTSVSREAGESLAIAALGFIANDAQLLPRFLALTGISSNEVRQAATEPGFLAGVLQFIVAHEPTLMQFAESMDIEPKSVMEALRALPTGDDNYEKST